MKIKITLTSFLILFSGFFSWACTFETNFCLEATLVNDERIVVGEIINSMPNSIELSIIDVLYGVENSSTITIWDGATIICNGGIPNYANDMGNVSDTILCLIEPITSIENPWDVIGEYRRPSLLGGYATFSNFSQGYLLDFTYGYDEVLALDIANYCCDTLSQIVNTSIYGLPGSTGSSSPISLIGYPQGGTFSGPGVVFNAFNPSIAGAGTHTINYTMNDEFGCSFTTQQNILVFTIIYNFVEYNLGTISPKISNELNIEVEVPEQDQYTFKIFDLSGKQLHHKAVHLQTGTHLENIQLHQELPKGIYLLNLSNSLTNTTQKFMVNG